jgi:8-oxo-dGTP pyrophosphatase MutT (NUDIX family)
MPNYIMDLRKFVGHRPLLMCCAGVIICDGLNRILLQRRADNDAWGILGGALELGESLEEAAQREVFEESGLVVDDLRLFKVYSGRDMHYIYPNGDEVYIVDHIFITKNFSGKLAIDHNESKEIQFFDLNNLPHKMHLPNQIVMRDLNAVYLENSLKIKTD